jgi:hypothetical protein
MGVRGVVFTDSLSTMMAESGNNHTKNAKTRKIRQLMDKRKGNVTLCWVPGHARITGNEETDKEAKRALDPERRKIPIRRWIKTEISCSRQRRCEEGENAMREKEQHGLAK